MGQPPPATYGKKALLLLHPLPLSIPSLPLTQTQLHGKGRERGILSVLAAATHPSAALRQPRLTPSPITCRGRRGLAAPMGSVLGRGERLRTLIRADRLRAHAPVVQAAEKGRGRGGSVSRVGRREVRDPWGCVGTVPSLWGCRRCWGW